MKLYIRTDKNAIIAFDKIVRFEALLFWDELGGLHEATIEDRRRYENWLTATNEDSDLENEWDFVERYYPNYDSSDQILQSDILYKILQQEYEEGDDTDKYFGEHYNYQLSEVTAVYEELILSIYTKAINGYIVSQQ